MKLSVQSSMGKFVWIASYPKSGNTWMRILLSNYLGNGKEPININRLDRAPIASTRLWFDSWAGVEATMLPDNIIERLRPDVYRCMAREEDKTLFIKVHDAWCKTDRFEGLFPEDVTLGVIYIVRNPLDLASSCANHWGISTELAVENLCDSSYTLACTSRGFSDQLQQKIGSWSSHIKSWVDESGLPIHLVRYEDMCQAPENVFKTVVQFCKLHVEKERITKAVAFSDFNELKRQEQSTGFHERSEKALSPFFRRGQAGSWREELPSNLVERIIDVHVEFMRRFGYLDDNNQPI